MAKEADIGDAAKLNHRRNIAWAGLANVLGEEISEALVSIGVVETFNDYGNVYAEVELVDNATVEIDRLRAANAKLLAAFNKAANDYGRLYEGKTNMLPANYKPPPDDVKAMAIWRELYETVIGTK